MWLITGPFDGELGDNSVNRTKLLKAGKSYTLGRKDRPLLINNKKISHDHSVFKVAPCTAGDIENPAFVPKLEVHNIKAKPIALTRGDETQVIEASSLQQLEDGDRVCILAGVVLEVRWQRVSCFVPPTRYASISQETCAAIGISALPKSHPLHTHHLTPKFDMSAPTVTSLLSATQLVKPEWLTELIRLGTTLDEGDSSKPSALEQVFQPPLETKYRPTFSPALPTPLKTFKIWEPNEERINMFRGYRFVLVAAKDGEVDGSLRELVVRGGGEYEGFNITAGHGKWRQLLAKGKRKVEELGSVGKELIIVAEDGKMKELLGSDSWRDFVADAKSLGLHAVDPKSLLQAAIHVDLSHLDAVEGAPPEAPDTGEESPLPDYIPNTHPEEPSYPGPASEPVSRKASRPPAPLPPSEVPERKLSQSLDDEPPSPPRKLLTRRAHLASRGVNLDDSTTSIHLVSRETPVESRTPSEPPDDSAPTRPTRLKRRAETAAPRLTIEQMLMMDDEETTQQPPLKKFKALFEASDPDKGANDGTQSIEAAYDSAVNDGSEQQRESQSLTQTDTIRTASGNATRLQVVAEEEEEGTPQSGPSFATRRRAPDSGDAMAVDIPIESCHTNNGAKATQVTRGVSQTRDKSVAPTQAPVSKKQKKPTSTQHAVDTDEAFLTAVASTKRGKKAEDSFDREFNNLRISKPDLQREEQEEAWRLLGDFDDVPNIRGNFMMILDMEIYKSGGTARIGGGSRNPLWDSRPNFKKFKKKSGVNMRTPVEVMINTDNDYGMGSGYWKDNSQPSQAKAPAASQRAKSEARTVKNKRRTFTVSDSDQEENLGDDSLFGGKPSQQALAATAVKASAEQLFLDTDEEDQKPIRTGSSEIKVLDADDSETLEPAPSIPPTKRTGKKRAIIADDDSDDGATFKGFGKKRRKMGR
ncbi:proline-rich protein [Hygrophoropsis aurantiaca]|uniref:Proline-rich protein n=1 Tax=Hygrophoropsis aurantiaca TaxID=72124 RepID=A0ACB8A6M1_9AGAM|nr:proline-rich protein [Hygrophoropsis aurantiaca]